MGCPGITLSQQYLEDLLNICQEEFEAVLKSKGGHSRHTKY
jgi:hypothetical protein